MLATTWDYSLPATANMFSLTPPLPTCDRECSGVFRVPTIKWSAGRTRIPQQRPQHDQTSNTLQKTSHQFSNAKAAIGCFCPKSYLQLNLSKALKNAPPVREALWPGKVLPSWEDPGFACPTSTTPHWSLMYFFKGWHKTFWDSLASQLTIASSHSMKSCPIVSHGFLPAATNLAVRLMWCL